MMVRKKRMGFLSNSACMAARSLALFFSSRMTESRITSACARPPRLPFGRCATGACPGFHQLAGLRSIG